MNSTNIPEIRKITGEVFSILSQEYKEVGTINFMHFNLSKSLDLEFDSSDIGIAVKTLIDEGYIYFEGEGKDWLQLTTKGREAIEDGYLASYLRDKAQHEEKRKLEGLQLEKIEKEIEDLTERFELKLNTIQAKHLRYSVLEKPISLILSGLSFLISLVALLKALNYL
ncbi:hypothetical protein [Lewinella sp. JB7]|uniref:hypothetical protein n=1 Tax=Lewinella sp. JB7 TaxID=2962887 RepID=UPI0020C9ADD5|nr:hypothetical protein [Lewinella sp. JB7]MCP9237084.1 hypothetical protein [Lewinella sp. JB7]